MKKKKFIYFVFMLFALMLVLPNVYALSETERLEKLNLIPTTTIGETEYIDMVSINPDIILSDNRCNYTTRQDIINSDPERYAVMTPELELEIANNIEESINSCIQDYREVLLNFTLKDMNVDFYNYYYEFTDSTHLKITYSDEDGNSSKNVILRYKENNTTIRNNIIRTKEKIQKRYTIYGLAVINSVVHYGGINANIYDNDLVLYRFPELKELMEENPDYEFSIRLRGAGGNPYETGNGGFISVFKNNVLYDLKETMFSMNHILYIDKDASGTIYERAEKRISSYLNNKYEVTVDTTPIEVFTDDLYMNKEINSYLGQTSGNHTGTYTEVHIGGVDYTILIVEIPKSSLDIVDIKSKDMLTGINIKTNSYEVPIDVQVEAESVKDTAYVVKAINNNKLKIVNAYDINLKKVADGTLVKEIADGVEVYIPIKGYKNGDNLNVYYIKSDSTIGETLIATVVTVDEVMYAKFVTDHFSTYAIGNLIIDNPKTGDTIMKSVIIGSVSLIVLIGIVVFVKKKKHD